MQINYLWWLFPLLLVVFLLVAFRFHGRLPLSRTRAMVLLAAAFAATLANSLTNLLGTPIAMATSGLALGVFATILVLAFFEWQQS